MKKNPQETILLDDCEPLFQGQPRLVFERGTANCLPGWPLIFERGTAALRNIPTPSQRREVAVIALVTLSDRLPRLWDLLLTSYRVPKCEANRTAWARALGDAVGTHNAARAMFAEALGL